jgi:hypothetical protein
MESIARQGVSHFNNSPAGTRKMKPRNRTSSTGWAFTLLICVMAVVPCSAESNGAKQPRSLADIPILQGPAISVDATGFQQVGHHVEMSALVKNSSQALDATESAVTFAAFGANDQLLGQQTVEIYSIPSDTTIAASAAVDLDSDAEVVQVRAFVSQSDAPIPRAGRAPLTATEIQVTVDPDGTLSVAARIPSKDMHPGPYRVDAVVIDHSGAIIGSARLEHLDPGKGEWTQFAAKGAGRSGRSSQPLSAIVTVLPSRADDHAR